MKKPFAAGLLGFLVLSTQVAYGWKPPPQRPQSHAGTTVVPDDLLRRWDPVTVFFDRDRGPTGGGAETRPEQWVTVTPDHPGAYTWLDARTLQFRPAEPWPPLARYQWNVEGKSFSLATLMAPPTQSIPAHNAEGLEEVTAVTLTFSEPMDPEALARMVTIELQPLPGMGSGEERWLTREDFHVKPLEQKSRSDAATYVLALHHPISLGMLAVVHLRLSLDDDPRESFTTIEFSTAQPFRITGAGCQGNVYPMTRDGARYTRDQAIDCGSGDRSLEVRFSAPPRGLGPVEARNLVRFTPVVDNLSFSVYDKTLRITGNFAWETLYQVELVPHAISDTKGRVLDMTGDSRVYLYFPRKPAYLEWRASQGVVERFGPQFVPVAGRADERVDLRVHVLDPLDRSFWPFPERPVTVDESKRPPGPGEEPAPFRIPNRAISTQELEAQLSALGSPPLSTLVDLPLRREGNAAAFGLDLEPHLDSIAGVDRPGSYLVGIRRLDESLRSWMRIQVTDLSLTAVEEPRAVRFSVNSLSTGKPIPGAKISIEGSRRSEETLVWTTLGEGTTDLQGSFTWSAPGYSPGVQVQVQRIVVEKGDDRLVLDPTRPPDVYSDNNWSPSNETWLQWAFHDLAYRTSQPETVAHIFTERPVYRPDETVHIKGYLRQRHKGELSIVPFSGFVVVGGPGDLVWRYPVELTESGSFYHAFSEKKIPTGVYSARIEGQNGNLYKQVSFRIEAYRLPRFEVNLHAPDRAALDREFEVSLSANYYAGGRVSGRPVEWRVTQFPHSWTPRKREGFHYSSDGRYSRTGEFSSSPQMEMQDTTDDEGSASIVLNPAIEPTAQPRSYVIEATVIGADDQTVTATRQVIALPPFVLGLKVPRFIERAQRIEPEILVVGPDDAPIPGKEVTVRLLHRQWHSVLRASDFSDGVARYVTDVVDEKVQETTVVSAEQPVTVTLPLERAGVYVVELEARDRLERAQVVAVDLYAGGDEPVTWSKPTSQVFTVTSDKDAYDPGETATLVLQSPFQEAEVLAVVEAPDGNHYRWLHVQGGAASFEWPIVNTYVPRVPVHFVLMRGRLPGTTPLPGNQTDAGKPTTLASTAWVEVNPRDHRLEVELEHPEKALPGKTIDVTIRLQDPDGNPRPGEVTLWLVDQAVLALGTEQRLDPVPDFITAVRSRLAVRDTRNLAFGHLPFAEYPGGGEGEEEAPSLLDRVTVRRNFQPVPYFNPAIPVGPDGTATVQMDLPDNLTNFKVRAKAVSGQGRFGFAVGHLAVRLPVIVQPALPRFVRPGDTFTAAAIGRVVEGEGGPGSAEIQTEGVEVQSATQKTLDWIPNQPERIEFDVSVPTPPYSESGELGYREVTFRVAVERSSDSAGDGFEVKLPIQDDRQRVTLRTLQDLEPGTPLAVPEVREAARPGTVRRSILASDQPGLVRMAAGLDFLLNYPFGCTEQRISRARAQIALRRFRNLLHQEGSALAEEHLERAVRETLEWIALSVDNDGLISYWPGAGGYVSLTAWVVEFLVEARDAGFPIDEPLLEKLTRALEGALRSDYSRFIDGEAWAERSWALGALASAGKFNPSYAAELARRSDYLDLEGVSQVVVSFARAGDTSSPTVQTLTQELWDGLVIRLFQGNEIYGGLQTRRPARNGLILPSETRTLAQMTRALGRVQSSDDRYQVLVNALVGLGRDDGWGTTNANASALLALAGLLEPPFEGGSRHTIDVRIGAESHQLAIGPDNPAAFHVATSTDPAEIVLGPEPTETGRPVVARVETTYIPAADGSQVAPESNGFVVTRELLRMLEGDEPPERTALDEPGKVVSFSTGQIVEEKVQVVNPKDRHYVAVVVPLSAGMEPLNPNLATAPPEARPSHTLTLQPTYVAFLDDHVAFYYDTLPQGTYDFYFRTRATTPGSFIQPAARTEMMYDGSVFGHSAGARIEVIRQGDEN